MKRLCAIVLLAGLAIPVSVIAQGTGGDEVIVTAMRREADDFDANTPAVGLKRTADFAVQEINIVGDTRDPTMRANEIYAMLANALHDANKGGVVLAFGERTLQSVTLSNYRDLSLERDSRPDSQKLSFLVKVPLQAGGDAKSAEGRIAAFVKAVKPVGRAQMETTGDLTLSVVAPDQYRGAIADAVAADAKAMAARLGPDYGVEIEGLNRPVEWTRAGLSDVLLYVPYKLVIVPKR